MAGRLGRLAVALLVLALALPATAGAHAALERTTPARGAQLARPPGQVLLHFDEAVDATLGAVRVFDAAGRAVQAGPAFHPGGRGADVAVRLPAGLPGGGYTVTFRVMSDDSHPVSGGFTFTVGAGRAAGASVGHLLRGQTAGSVTATAFSVVRAVQYAAIAVGLGGLIFLLACLEPVLAAGYRADGGPARPAAGFAGRQRGLLGAAAVAGLVSAVAGLGLEGAQAAGSSVWQSLTSPVLHDVLDTRFGVVWGLAALAWLIAAMWALIDAPPRWLVVPLAPLVLLPALSGHPSTQSPVWLMLLANVVHVGAMSAWLGGVAALVLALPGATRSLGPPDRIRLLSPVVARFSRLAGAMFATLLATGVIQGVIELASVPALVDTAFGRAVLIKLVLFAALVAAGHANRSRLLPGLRATGDRPGRAEAALGRVLRLELALGAVVLAVTGALAGYSP